MQVLINNINYELDSDTLTASVCHLDAGEYYRGDIVIPATVVYNNTTYRVTSIGRFWGPFQYCRDLKSVTIPNSVTTIEDSAFEGCTGLTSITIPNNVTSIGKWAFKGCTGLTSITIPDSVTSIGKWAFKGCTGLTSITIPDSVTSIGWSAFSGCTGLTSITIPDSVTSIGDSAFSGCTGLTSITIPDSVTNIGKNAFKCTGLTSITFPDSVTSIGSGAFNGCTSLTSIIIPNNVTSVGDSAFYGCSGLTSIAVKNGNKKYDSRYNCNAIIETATNTLIAGCQNTIISDSVTSIGNEAFAHCSGLSSIIIPKSIASIGYHAFYSCSGLTSIVVESGNNRYDSRNNCNAIIETATNSLTRGCKNTIIPNITSIGNGAFSGSTGLTSITIPNSVTSIGNCAFRGCTDLSFIAIPNNITSIGNGAFCDCSRLTSITIPDSVTSIEEGTFFDCINLTSVTIHNSVTSIGNGAFKGCSGMVSIIVPNSVTKIGDYAFYGCNGLTSVAMPNSVTSIGKGAFSRCISISSVTIPNGVTSIGQSAFFDCTYLTAVTLPKSISEIGKNVFLGCENLQTIRVPQGMTDKFCQMGLEPWRDKIVEPRQEEYTILLNIARGYELGIGMARNLAQAVLCYAQAADKGCAEAAYHLGELYAEGKGLPQDYQQAADWFGKAAALYHPNGAARQQECLHIIEEEAARLAAFEQEQQAERQAQLARITAVPKSQKTILFFDTETNGLPRNYKAGITDTSNWPRLIQIGWLITDEAGNILKRKSQLIYPHFTIDADVTRLTGITTAQAQREGTDLAQVLREFAEDAAAASLIVGHNIDFDLHVVGCELYREGMDYRTLLNKPTVCTMQRSTNFCAIPSTNSYYSGYKYPTLTELYTKLFGCAFSGAHDALTDITATKDCYFELRRRGII